MHLSLHRLVYNVTRAGELASRQSELRWRCGRLVMASSIKGFRGDSQNLAGDSCLRTLWEVRCSARHSGRKWGAQNETGETKATVCDHGDDACERIKLSRLPQTLPAQ